MPSSYVDSFAPIIKVLIERAPRRVLDIGPGWGKYGLACREYLRQLDVLDAAEVPQGRLPTQPAIYDMVYIGDIREAPDHFFRGYDLVLLIDVIEHVRRLDGHLLLETIQRAGADVLVSTPKAFFEQHDEHNPYETHVSHWDWESLACHGIDVDVSTPDAIIYVLKGRR
jgi:2-polyprenyl-3-methyl-5-hydroxy-6-metoxy-1,4-benzoquinol methylase